MADLIPRDAALEVVAVMICPPSVKIAAEHRIDALPSVNAIPVEWLREKMRSAYEPDSKAAWRVLKMWKGEHDVHD